MALPKRKGFFYLLNICTMKSEAFLQRLEKRKSLGSNLPKKELVHGFIDEFKDFLFPDCSCCTNYKKPDLSVNYELLYNRLADLIKAVAVDINININQIVDKYFGCIPEVYDKLLLDAQAIDEFDPASYSIEEIIMTYPGFQAIFVYRLANPLYKLGIPVIPRIMSEYAHMQTGIDINPGATIGESFFIDHGTGIVIGETTLIGDNVKIYQGVTLGALNVRKEDAKVKRHPTIEDNVIVYSGTTILGGNTTIGHDSVVGGNVWLTKSIGPYSVVHNLSEIRVRNAKSKSKQEIDFVI